MNEPIRPRVQFDDAPLMIYWETTQACDLACRHCRASAMPERDPGELTTGEARDLLRQICEFRSDADSSGGAPRYAQTLILTGGDPIKRPDLFELIGYARELGLPVGITPSGTTSLTPAVIRRLADSGIGVMALSLDGSDAVRHDAFRAVAGCFQQTIDAAHAARAAGLPLQINTTVSAETVADLPAIARVVGELGAMRWSVFFLVPIGRGAVLGGIGRHEAERVLEWLYDFSKSAPFQIKTTEAHHYRRILLERAAAEGRTADDVLDSPAGFGFGIRDGAGIVFISHRGDVYPSGFLPIAAGNIREKSLAELYRHADIFRQLRDVDGLLGKCGHCEYRWVCGGSRARAFALTGNAMASDPLCAYQPARAGNA